MVLAHTYFSQKLNFMDSPGYEMFLRALRKRLRLTQTEFAAQIGVSRTTYKSSSTTGKTTTFTRLTPPWPMSPHGAPKSATSWASSGA